MSTSSTRRPCPRDQRRELLAHQGYVCAYCAEPFGSVIRKRGRRTITSVHYDHAVPFAYLNANPRWNWVAACNICNQIKGAKLFDSISEIRLHILGIRDKRNDTLDWVPPVSSEEDPESWANAFSAYLSSVPTDVEVDDWPASEYRPQPVKRGKKAKGPWPWSK
jgi:5-methylcytosine-specific restriction endonuclease McrA